MGRESMLKQAFLNQYNVILVGGMALFSLASGSVVPLVLAGVGEAVWVIAGPRSGRFKRWVTSQARRREEQRWRTQVETTAAGIDPNAAARLRLVGGVLMQIVRGCVERGDPQLAADVNAALPSLLQDYASLAAAHQRLARLMEAGGTAAVEDEIVRVGRSLADEKDATVRISLRQALALAQRRLKRFEQVDTLGRELAAKLATFGNSLEYVRTQVLGDPPEEILVALNEAHLSSRFDVQREAEAARASRERRTTGSFAVVPPVDPR